MKASATDKTSTRLTLRADSAGALMKPNPVCLKQTATVSEAIDFLTSRGFSAAPVIDGSGRPVGVLSRSDLLIHVRNAPGRNPGSAMAPDEALVRDLMTPAVFSVTPETSAKRVVEGMIGCNVHRLYVVDESGVLVGVISPLDVLQQLSEPTD